MKPTFVILDNLPISLQRLSNRTALEILAIYYDLQNLDSLFHNLNFAQVKLFCCT